MRAIGFFDGKIFDKQTFVLYNYFKNIKFLIWSYDMGKVNDKRSDLELARILWNYMYLGEKLRKCDCILGLGCADKRIPKRCAELYHQGYADIVIFSGGHGKITKNIWRKTEARTFFEIAVKLGVPKDRIILENKASNTGENFLFTEKLIREKGLDIKSFLIVQKPYSERRNYAAFKALLPGKECVITSVDMDFFQYVNDFEQRKGDFRELISLIVGDVQRIEVYAQKGWQIKQDMPKKVKDALQELIRLGYDKYLVKDGV